MDHLLISAEERGARMAQRLGATGPGALDTRIAGARRRRTSRIVAAAVPVAALAVWGGVVAVQAVGSEPQVAAADRLHVSLEDPLEPQVAAAIQAHDHEALALLFELGAFPYEARAEGSHWAGLAGEQCDLEALEILDVHGVPRENPLEWTTDEAVRGATGVCDAAVVMRIIDGSPAVIDQATVMTDAVDAGASDLVTLLLQDGYPTEGDDWNALWAAVQHRDLATVEALLGGGADVTAEVDGQNVLDYAARIDAPEDIQAALLAAARGL